MEEMKRFRCSIMRGGTSKAVFFLENDIPRDPAKRKKFILAVFGSPDKRQIDGLGGADPLTSKCAVIGPPTKEGADIDYSFFQVGINSEVVKPGICGNISAAVGPFAIDEGLVRAVEPVTKIVIYSPDVDKTIIAEVETRDGKAVVEGDYEIDGVPGTGARVKLDWKNVVGGETGALLPTGNVKDKINVPGIDEITVSIVDSANPVVFIRAADIGLKGTEVPAEVDSNPALLEKLELIRGTAGELVGLLKDKTKSREQNPRRPLLAFVASSAPYVTFSGKKVNAEDMELSSRVMFMQTMHKTYSASAALCTGTAAMIEGTVVNELMAQGNIGKKIVRIGHPAGIIEVESGIKKVGDKFIVTRSVISRTARKIMDGYVYLRRDRLG